MKTQIHSKILAIAAAVMLGIATTGGTALARGGGGLGGGFGGAHWASLAAPMSAASASDTWAALASTPWACLASRWIATSAIAVSAARASRMNSDTTTSGVFTVFHCTTQTIVPSRLI
jgi:hypothetical protein